MTCKRIRTAAEARQYIGQRLTWFDPMEGVGEAVHTDTLRTVAGPAVLLGNSWRLLGHIWAEPAATFTDERFIPERKGMWSRFTSFLQSLFQP
jgi:hypothetical protein